MMEDNHTLSLSFFCSQSRPALLVSVCFCLVKTSFSVPCAVVVLHLGFQRWRTSSGPPSHTDVFTYHGAVLDLVFVLGGVLFLVGDLCGLLLVKVSGLYLSSCSFPGPVLLHVLTCLERYLAVVHPVIYLRLRRSRGSRIRDGALVCTWLLCVGWSAAGTRTLTRPFLPTFLLLGLALVFVTLSSLRVLWVLVRPKPGEGGGASGSKMRAFQTMTAITATLWMWLLGVLVSLALSTDQGSVDGCVLLVSGYWFTLPSVLVLPLLFLHRAGKLGCKCVLQNQH